MLDTVRCLNIDDKSADGMVRRVAEDGSSSWVIDIVQKGVPIAALHVLTDRSFIFLDLSSKERTRFRSVPETQTFLIQKFFT